MKTYISAHRIAVLDGEPGHRKGAHSDRVYHSHNPDAIVGALVLDSFAMVCPELDLPPGLDIRAHLHYDRARFTGIREGRATTAVSSISHAAPSTTTARSYGSIPTSTKGQKGLNHGNEGRSQTGNSSAPARRTTPSAKDRKNYQVHSMRCGAVRKGHITDGSCAMPELWHGLLFVIGSGEETTNLDGLRDAAHSKDVRPGPHVSIVLFGHL